MITLVETETFSAWLAGLRDGTARARVQRRLDRLKLGNPGDVKPVGEGVSEMRIDYGPGYRIYYLRRGEVLVVLLAGGDKRSQSKDIKTAIRLAEEVKKLAWPS